MNIKPCVILKYALLGGSIGFLLPNIIIGIGYSFYLIHDLMFFDWGSFKKNIGTLIYTLVTFGVASGLMLSFIFVPLSATIGLVKSSEKKK